MISIKCYESVLSLLLKLFHKFESSGILSNIFYKVTISLTLKENKDITRKVNSTPISLMNNDVKILNKIFANLIQQYIYKN